MKKIKLSIVLLFLSLSMTMISCVDKEEERKRREENYILERTKRQIEQAKLDGIRLKQELKETREKEEETHKRYINLIVGREIY